MGVKEIAHGSNSGILVWDPVPPCPSKHWSSMSHYRHLQYWSSSPSFQFKFSFLVPSPLTNPHSARCTADARNMMVYEWSSPYKSSQLVHFFFSLFIFYIITIIEIAGKRGLFYTILTYTPVIIVKRQWHLLAPCTCPTDKNSLYCSTCVSF